MILISGKANPFLAQKIATLIQLPLSPTLLSNFSDGETRVEIHESCFGQPVIIIQPTCPPVNDNLMELMLLADAALRSGATHITAVIPYFGYARQDKLKTNGIHVPLGTKVIANCLNSAAIDKVITVDLHTEHAIGFFGTSSFNILPSSLFFKDIQQQNYKQPVIISPDLGGVCRARHLAQAFPSPAPLVILDKNRVENGLKAEIVNMTGTVKGHTCILVDDIVDSAATLCAAAHALKAEGASKIVAYCTHALFSNDSLQQIQASPIDELVVTNTVAHSLPLTSKIRVLDIAPLLAETLLAQNPPEL